MSRLPWALTRPPCPPGPAQGAPGHMPRGHERAWTGTTLASLLQCPSSAGCHSRPLTELQGSLLKAINGGTAKEVTSQRRLPITQSRAPAGPHTVPHSPQHHPGGLGPGLSPAPPLSPDPGASGSSLRSASQLPPLRHREPSWRVWWASPSSGAVPGSEAAPWWSPLLGSHELSLP